MESTIKAQMLEEVEEEDEGELMTSHHLFFPLQWLQMLAKEMHWSFIYSVVAVNGVSQGLGGAVCRVAFDYYWKEQQHLLPSEAQVYQGITSLPWIIKPLWALLTDLLPIAGCRRKPYFILAGLMGVISMLILWLHKDLCTVMVLLLLTAANAGVAIADVTIDACVAEKSITHSSMATDMQSLCGLSSSIGGLLGFSISGFLMNAMGSKAVFGLLSLPAALVCSVGMVMKEQYSQDFPCQQIHEKLMQANKTMWATLKCDEVWRPCIFIFASLALSLNIQEGMFYWYTDNNTGPSFSQGTISFIYTIGSVGCLLGVLLYQTSLKHYPFRCLLFWSHIFSTLAGMLDVILVLRINLKLGVADRTFAVIDECFSQLIGRLRWMPIVVLSSKLCPMGIEGTFFALLMSIDHGGLLASSWAGGVLLQILKVSRTEFGDLWKVILIRNVLRLAPLLLLRLVPQIDDRPAVVLKEGVVPDMGFDAVDVEGEALVPRR